MPKLSYIKNYRLQRFRVMSNKEVREFSEKLKSGLEIAEKRMLEEKALRDETIVVSSAEGSIQYLSAREVLATF